MIIRAVGLPGLTVSDVEPGPLIAMKLQSMMNRGAAKEATDLLDIIRLTLDLKAGPTSRRQLSSATLQLTKDAALHARRWFHQYSSRSLTLVRTVPEGRDTEIDDLTLVGDLLLGATSE